MPTVKVLEKVHVKGARKYQWCGSKTQAMT